MQNKRNLSKVMFGFIALAVCLIAGLLTAPVRTEAATKAKVVLEFTDGTQETWQTGDDRIALNGRTLAYIYFGSYPQTEVAKVTKKIKNASYDENGIAKVSSKKYRRLSTADATYICKWSDEGFDWKSKYNYETSEYTYGKEYAYFKYEPVKWRVLSNSNGVAFLLSEYALDNQMYNADSEAVTWAECTLRTWLNNDFLTLAFNAKERKLIKTTTLTNEDNPYYGIAGGASTKDKIYLLSLSDSMNEKYGFIAETYDDSGRNCSATDFAKAMGGYIFSNKKYATAEGLLSACWWLRSPGNYSDCASYVSGGGCIYDYGKKVSYKRNAIRPALRLNLSSVIE